MEATIFISYAHTDSYYKDELEKHLSVLKDNGKIIQWSDGQILPGDKWDLEIKRKLKTAKIILLLVSSDFLSSKYIKQHELSEVLERNDNNECRVIPIILRHCDWQDTELGSLQAIPKKDGRILPISAWKDLDEALNIVTTQIKRVFDNSTGYPSPDKHIDNRNHSNPYSTQSPTVVSVTTIGGKWHDTFSVNNGFQITQEGSTFQFWGWGILPNGIQFQSTGSGTITAETITSRYTANYQNGWVSQGNCSGTVSPNGSQMTLTCTDNLLGTFVSSRVRE